MKLIVFILCIIMVTCRSLRNDEMSPGDEDQQEMEAVANKKRIDDEAKLAKRILMGQMALSSEPDGHVSGKASITHISGSQSNVKSVSMSSGTHAPSMVHINETSAGVAEVGGDSIPSNITRRSESDAVSMNEKQKRVQDVLASIAVDSKDGKTSSNAYIVKGANSKTLTPVSASSMPSVSGMEARFDGRPIDRRGDSQDGNDNPADTSVFDEIEQDGNEKPADISSDMSASDDLGDWQDGNNNPADEIPSDEVLLDDNDNVPDASDDGNEKRTDGNPADESTWDEVGQDGDGHPKDLYLDGNKLPDRRNERSDDGDDHGDDQEDGGFVDTMLDRRVSDNEHSEKKKRETFIGGIEFEKKDGKVHGKAYILNGKFIPGASAASLTSEIGLESTKSYEAAVAKRDNENSNKRNSNVANDEELSDLKFWNKN